MDNYIYLLSQNIKKYRLMRCFTQEKLAELLFITKQSISKWELGLSVPTTENIVYMCNLLNCSANDLLADSINAIKETTNKNQTISSFATSEPSASFIGGMSTGLYSSSSMMPNYSNNVSVQSNSNLDSLSCFRTIDNCSGVPKKRSIFNNLFGNVTTSEPVNDCSYTEPIMSQSCENVDVSYELPSFINSKNYNCVNDYGILLRFLTVEELNKVCDMFVPYIDSNVGIAFYDNGDETIYYDSNIHNFVSKHIESNEKYDLSQRQFVFDNKSGLSMTTIDDVEIYKINTDVVLLFAGKQNQ